MAQQCGNCDELGRGARRTPLNARLVSRDNAVMPLPLIRTDRLLLCPWAREDLEALHALVCEPEVRRFLWDGQVIVRATTETLIDAHLHTQQELNLSNQRSVALMVRLGMQHVSSTATGIKYELERPGAREHASATS
jgi:hypothetical protein